MRLTSESPIGVAELHTLLYLNPNDAAKLLDFRALPVQCRFKPYDAARTAPVSNLL
jgi:hypothetical protein